MSMTTLQATRLGSLIAKARGRKGLSLRDLQERTGLGRTWLSDVEQGRLLNPPPDRLATLADVLDIEPARIDRMTDGSMSYGLPSPRAYFRAKLDLTPEQADEVSRYIENLRRSA